MRRKKIKLTQCQLFILSLQQFFMGLQIDFHGHVLKLTKLKTNDSENDQ